MARTADDLVRYHGKMIIIDRRELYVLAFNFTHLDIEHSRSFGVVTRNPKAVQEAAKLFEADMKRQNYTPGLPEFIVSPANARKQLSAFLKGARRQLLIYDPKVADPAMIRLLEERAKAGVEIRIVGALTRKMHTRMILRDGQNVFIGSQSLRTAELDTRREVGLIFRDLKIASRLAQTFDNDWNLAEDAGEQKSRDAASSFAKVAKKVAKAVTKELPPVGPVVEVVVKDVAGAEANLELNSQELQHNVKEAVRDAVKQAVKGVVQEAVEQTRK